MKKIPRGSERRPRKEFPYFKVQYRQNNLEGWRDYTKSIQHFEEAEAFIYDALRQLKKDRKTAILHRVMKVESDRKRYPLDKIYGTLDEPSSKSPRDQT
jgi:hypothetical protein